MAPEHKDYLELRADWLKLQGCLFDQTTGLPALPTVLEDVRRRIEEGRRIGLIYLDLSSEARLESIYGWEAYDSLLHQVARTLELYRAQEMTTDDPVAIYGVRGDEFLLFPTLASGHDPEQQLLDLRGRLTESLTEGIQIQFDKEQARAVSFHSGIGVVRIDPMIRLERSIYRTIDEVRSLCQRQREKEHTRHLQELRRIVTAADIMVRFQPIVRLRDGQVHGFEALSCGPPGSLFENPEMLFSFAEETDLIVDLERICRLESIRRASELGPDRKLFINCSARGFTDPELFCRSLVDQAERSGLSPGDIIIEITERVAITAWQEFRRSVAALRLIGFSIAIDDMGAGYSSLKSVAEVQPEYLKVDLSLVRDVHSSPIKRSLLESLVTMAGNIGARVIAEGVEKEEEFHVLREMDVNFAQGFFFARPNVSPGGHHVFFP